MEDLRRSMALMSEPSEPDRVTIYDPIRERVRSPGNLTKAFEREIADVVRSLVIGISSPEA
jgi:hypothetical protein